MATEVIVRPSAEADVRESAFWYEATQHPLQFPEIGEGARRALLRRFPYAVYFVADDAPVVLAVLHQHRKPQTWRERA